MENPIKMDDLEIPLFSETSISWYCGNSAGDLFLDGLIKCLFEWLSDLHLQNQKVTLNHLENKPTSFRNIFLGANLTN